MDVERFALIAAGAFFLVGLLSGVWKYAAIARSKEARAPTYVDIAHRASLLYAFACLLLERLLQVSALAASIEWVAAVAQITFFAMAVTIYLVHGWLNDTDNQLARPHRLGKRALPGVMVHGFMVSLVVAEVGGFAVLLFGAVTSTPF